MKFLDDERMLARMIDEHGVTEENARASLRISKNPIIPRYIDRMERDPKHFQIETTEDVIGEQLTLAAAAYTNMEITNANPETIDDLRTWLGRTIERAVPYLWEDDTRIAAANMKMPDHIIDPNNTLPFPAVWWTFPSDLTAYTEELSMVNVLLCQHPEQGMMIYEVYQRKETGLPVAHGLIIPAYAKYPEWTEEHPNLGPAWTRTVGCYLAMCAFLRSKSFEKTEKRLHRAVRREAKRKNLPIGVRDSAYFVNLRPVEGEEKPASEPTGNEGNYSCQWLVSGHFKAQWYPSRQAHEVIYIDPYRKGPKDKPFRAKSYRVNR